MTICKNNKNLRSIKSVYNYLERLRSSGNGDELIEFVATEINANEYNLLYSLVKSLMLLNKMPNNYRKMLVETRENCSDILQFDSVFLKYYNDENNNNGYYNQYVEVLQQYINIENSKIYLNKISSEALKSKNYNQTIDDLKQLHGKNVTVGLIQDEQLIKISGKFYFYPSKDKIDHKFNIDGFDINFINPDNIVAFVINNDTKNLHFATGSQTDKISIIEKIAYSFGVDGVKYYLHNEQLKLSNYDKNLIESRKNSGKHCYLPLKNDVLELN